MNHELTSFLTRHRACTEGLSRLAVTGSATPEEAWERADAIDLIWAVTRPGVMSEEQRRKFLAEAVLAPIEHLLTDERSLIILRKLRTNERVTQEDKDASRAASKAAQAAAERASDAAAYAAAADDAWADAAWASAYESARAAVYASARGAQAKWIRDNFALSDLNIN